MAHSERCELAFKVLEFLVLRFDEGFRGESELEVRNLEILDREDDEIEAAFDVILISDGEEIPLSEEFGDEGPTPFVKEDGRWRLANCAGFGPIDDGSALPTPSDRLTGPRAAEADSNPLLPGDHVNLPAIYGGPYSNTAKHVVRAVAYEADGNSNPPAGGPHWGSVPFPADPPRAPDFCAPVPRGIYRLPWQAESLVHNMEHAGIVLWYNTDDQAIIDELESLILERLEAGQLLVMTPYPEMEAEHIALTGWSRIDKFPIEEYSRERVEQFIDVHERRFNPEDF